MKVYFVQCVGPHAPIKIGRARFPGGRTMDMQGACPYQLRLLASVKEGDGLNEHSLHKRFEKWRIRGEWFMPSQEIVSFVMDINPSARIMIAEPDDQEVLIGLLDKTARRTKRTPDGTQKRLRQSWLQSQKESVMVQLRQEHGWTLVRIAALFGISRQRVHQILGNSQRGFSEDAARDYLRQI